MELRKIEQLIEKYEAGETSLAEEQELRDYFSNAQVPAHLAAYRALFGYTNKAEKQTYSADFYPPKEKKNYVWSAVAAVILLAVGLFFFQNDLTQMRDGEMGSLSSSETDLEKTREAMQMVSDIMKEGSEDLIYLKEFSNTKNKFLLDN